MSSESFEMVSAGDIGVFRGGSGFPVRFQGLKSGELPFFKVSDMNRQGNELFMVKANNYVSEEVRASLGATRIPAGAIVFAKVGAAVYLERKRVLAQDSCIDNNMAAFIVDQSSFDVRFLHYLLSAFKLSSLVATTALPSLNGVQLRSIPLLMPSTVTEQREIASILSNVDMMIASIERLIEKKRSVKRGMVQELLSGTSRLPGFDAPWTPTVIASLGSLLKGRGVKRDDVRAAGVPCIRYGELYTTFSDYTDTTVSFVDADVASTALPIAEGDLLFAGSGETKADIGTCVAYVGRSPAVAGGDIIVLRAPSINPVFLASLLNTPQISAMKARSGQGDAVVHISARAIGELKVELPERPEQDAIARLIVDADRDLAAQGTLLEVVRNIKQGMMQELLTGRTRLNRQEAAA